MRVVNYSKSPFHIYTIPKLYTPKHPISVYLYNFQGFFPVYLYNVVITTRCIVLICICWYLFVYLFCLFLISLCLLFLLVSVGLLPWWAYLSNSSDEEFVFLVCIFDEFDHAVTMEGSSKSIKEKR